VAPLQLCASVPTTYRDGPRHSKAMHQRPLCKKYSIMVTIEAGRSGREHTVDKMSISILKSVERAHRGGGRSTAPTLRVRLLVLYGVGGSAAPTLRDV
jgi:hypothetical protein